MSLLRRSGIFGHLPAKFFAIVFAAVTVYLVNRELEIEWYDQDVPVSYFGAENTADLREAEKRGQPLVLLSFDPDVALAEPIGSVRLRLVGSAKERDAFRSNPIIELRVRSQWADDASGQGEHGLVDSDFRLAAGLKSARVMITERRRVKVDRIARRSGIRLKLKPPERMAGGRVYDEATTVINPSVVSVEGPRRWLEQLSTVTEQRDQNLSIELPKIGDGGHVAGHVYLAVLAEQWRSRGLRIVESKVDVMLGARAEETESIEFPNFQVRWRLRSKDLALLAAGELVLRSDVTMECRLAVRGPRSLISPWLQGDKRRELGQMLSAVVDPSRDIDELLPGGDARGPSLPILVSGVPAGLEVELVDARAVTCRIQRLKKED